MFPVKSAKISRLEIVLFLLFFLFSWLLMWKTFRSTDGSLQIASKAWSDFAATIPLIRSFAYGNNFPPEYPIFAGPPIRYHFIFFSFVGLLENIGIPLDWALNTLSALGFFSLLTLIYLIGKTIFKNKAVGIISTILFLFNGSWGFLEFFKKHPISTNSTSDIIHNTTFSSFGPYDGKIVSAFWSLNIFTNQRHLALAYAAFLLFIFFIYKVSEKPEKLNFKIALFLGVFIGLFPFVHLAVFGMMGISLMVALFIYPKIKKELFFAGLIAFSLALPQLIFMGKSEVETEFFSPGYLAGDLTPTNFFKYWFLNLGLASLLAPFGLFFAKKPQRKLFLIFLTLFVVGNLFQFSPEMAANHKFFNLFVIGVNIFSAHTLLLFWKKKFLDKILAVSLLFFLTLTGVIDLFPILNDRFITINDIANNKTAAFIDESTPKNAVFLNATYLYDPASLAGRKIYLGWPYFAWSAGYETTARNKKMQELLLPENLRSLCSSLEKEGIDYIEIQKPTNLEGISINYEFFEKNFERIFHSTQNNIFIYDVNKTCNS